MKAVLFVPLAVLLGGIAMGAEPPDFQAQRETYRKMYNDGNYKEAYEGLRKLATNPKDDPRLVREDLGMAVGALRRLNRVDEIDGLLEAAIDAHQDNWRLLHAAAQQYMNIPHQGFIVAGEFQRGHKRGGQGGQPVNSQERDRVRALQLMTKALPMARQDDDHATVGGFLLSLAEMLLNNRGYHEAWRLQYLTDLDTLPDYEPGWHGYHQPTRGAPVDAEGKPVFHHVPKSFEAAETDGQRWRWALEQAVEFNSNLRNQVRMQFADFLWNQFGVQTMAEMGWRFGRMSTDDTQDDESGTYALHTLDENETIARLATGIKRLALPEEFNFLRIYQQVAEDANDGYAISALEKLAQIFENRRQYPKAAEHWRRLLKEYPRASSHQRKNWQQRLDQIVDAWARFEPISSQPAGLGASVEFRFRNGEKVAFTAQEIRVEKLLGDVMDYLKSNPGKLDWQKAQVENIGYRLVQKNQKQYLGEQVAKWDLDLEPREKHFDKRITVTTPLQKPGAYFLTAKMADGNTSHIIVWVNDTAIIKKPLSNKNLYYVADAVRSTPVGGAKLDFFGYRVQHVRGRQYRVETKQFAERTDADGQIIVDQSNLPNNFQWLAIARTAQGRFAYLGFSHVWYGRRHDAEYHAVKAYSITDRPVYRPKQTVHYKFWVRRAQYDMEDVSQFAGHTLGIEIYDPKGDRLVQEEMKADEYGGVEGTLELPEDATLGVYRITIGEFEPGGNAAEQDRKALRTIGRAMLGRAQPFAEETKREGNRKMRQHYGAGTFRVEEYKKPEFEVTVDAPTEPVMLGETITATINAKYYFGSPVTQAKVKYKVTRASHDQRWYPPGPWDWFYGRGYWWFAYDYEWLPGWQRWGCPAPPPYWWPQRHEPPELVAEVETEIGEDGTVKVEIDTAVAQAIHPDQDHRYTITAEVVDASRRTIVGTGEVLVARKPFKVYAWVDRGYYRAGDTIQTHYAARTLDGRSVEGTGKLTVLKVTYEEGKPVETPVYSRDLNTNAEGRADVKLKANRPGQYRLSYELTDSKGHAITGGYLFTVIGESFHSADFRFNALELIPDKADYAPGEKVKLQINTDRTDTTVLLFVRPANGVYLEPRVVRLKGKSTIEEIEVSKKDMPNFFVEAVTVTDGRVHTQSREIVVPPEKRVLGVEIEPTKQAYKPGEKAKVRLKLTDFHGEPMVGSTVVAIYDKSVEYISGGSNVADIKEFFWKWRRHHHPRTETNLDRHEGNLVPKDAQGMADIGVFGATVADDLDAMGDRNGVAKDAQMNGRGGGMAFGNGAPTMSHRSFARNAGSGMEMDAEGMAMPMAAAAPAEAMEGDDMAFGDKSGAAPGGGAAMVEPTVRSQFADTALWVGALTTDKDGTAEVELDMPENLTTWRIKVWGMDHGTKVGEGFADVVTRKDLIVRLQAPRFFVEKDEVVLSAVVHNYLDSKKNVSAVLELEGGCLQVIETIPGPHISGTGDEPGPGFTEETIMHAGPAERPVEIAPGGEARVDWRVKVVKEGEAVIRMKALTDEESDAMEQTFPCYVHGMLKMDSYSGVLRPDDQSGSFTVNVPAERRAEQTRLEVRWSPTLAGAMVDALPYLVEYPYGCTEQTLNRFLPTVITQKVLLDMNLDLEEIQKKRTNLNAQEIGDDAQRARGWQRYDRNPVFDVAEVRRMVKEGVTRLSEMQLSDGGWGWFSGWGEHSAPHTTAVVVHGLQVARHNDVTLPGDMLPRGIEWLKRYQAEQVQLLNNAKDKQKHKRWKEHADNIDALVFMVLVDEDVNNAEMLEFLYRDRLKLSVYAMAMYGVAVEKLGQQDKLAMILRNIRQYVVEDDENQTAWLKLPESSWWHWYGSEYEAHAYYLKLLAKTDPKAELASRLVKYLLNNRKHATYWNSTRDTALCIEAMADFLRASEEDKPEMTVEVHFDGALQKAVEITPENLFTFDNKFVIEGEQVEPGPHKVELVRKGKGPLYYNGYMTNFTLEDFITKAGLEIKVQRKYYRLNPVERTVKAAGSRGQAVDQRVEAYEREELPNLATVESGQLCEIELVIESKNDYEYLVFEDYKPAGFEPVELRSGYNGNTLGAYMEFRDNRVVLFARTLARGTHSVSYRMRAEIPGKFSALPTKAWAMYAPELKANSDEIKLKVED